MIDTGIGIAADKLGTVFREFTRLDEGLREAQALGLGLSIVDRIARVLRLEIRIASDKGEGTRFSVVIPITDTAEPPALVQARSALPTAVALDGLTVSASTTIRILDGMRLLLEGWGCDVRPPRVHVNSTSQELPDPSRTSSSPIPFRRRDRARCDQKASRIIRVDVPAFLLTAARSTRCGLPPTRSMFLSLTNRSSPQLCAPSSRDSAEWRLRRSKVPAPSSTIGCVEICSFCRPPCLTPPRSWRR